MYSIAFITGMISSLHCIGMCGPLALSIPGFRNTGNRILEKIAYNLGRILTYSFLGFLIGILGRKLWIIGFQQILSILVGISILTFSLLRFLKISFGENALILRLVSPVQSLLVYSFTHRSTPFFIGILNGFLPCGFVYLALAEALNSKNPLSAAYFMFFFGLGTIPLMLTAMVGSGYIGPLFRKRLSSSLPYLLAIMGFWFILRGMSLSIPYLSPGKMVTWGISLCH
jgi:sulfite exporter TauE/SafE